MTLSVILISALAAPLDGALIEKLTGQPGALDAQSGVFKVSMPRNDLSVTTGGTTLTPALGLTAWAAFAEGPHGVMVMGDMVLLEDQVSPAMSAALDAGLEVTALHNHFLWDSPRVMFMHVGGMGQLEPLAVAVGKVFASIKATAGGKGVAFRAEVDPKKSTLDPKRIEALLGKGALKDGVYKVTIGRTVTMHGQTIGAAMGVNTWAAFAGSNDAAMVDGDFAVAEGELQPVLKSLRAAGLHVVAIHNHMTSEEPRLVFLHFLGSGKLDDLATALRRTLDLTHHD